MSVYEGHGVTLHHADCLDVLRSLPDCSVDSVVCDPPYALGFMGREWDTFGMDVGRGAQARSQRRAEVTPTGEGHSTSAGPYLASGVDSLRAAGLPFQRWCEAWATECLRVLKPGGHLLAFGGTRTWHRLACAVEDAGFEVRDSIAWLYGSGFPKSLDVSKAIDKAAGAEREASGVRGNTQCGYLDRGEQCPGHDDAGQSMSGATVHRLPTAPATDAAREWEGWGTALKPAFEPVVVARKPLTGTVAANVLAWGTGALNVDGCRVGPKPDTTRGASVNASSMAAPLGGQGRILDDGKGRWPANVVLDESQAEALDEQSGTQRDGTAVNRNKDPKAEKPHEVYGGGWLNGDRPDITYGGQGGASRFFYVAKADGKGRWPANVVLDESQAAALDEQSGERPGFATQNFDGTTAGKAEGWGNIGAIGGERREGFNDTGGASRFMYVAKADATERPRVNGTAHPTVKPLSLMRWLVRLVTPPGGTVLEPFAGSGTTVEACIVEGFQCIAIEKGEEYLPLIMQRIHRRRDPVAAIRQTGDELGLFELDGEGA